MPGRRNIFFLYFPEKNSLTVKDHLDPRVKKKTYWRGLGENFKWCWNIYFIKCLFGLIFYWFHLHPTHIFQNIIWPLIQLIVFELVFIYTGAWSLAIWLVSFQVWDDLIGSTKVDLYEILLMDCQRQALRGSANSHKGFGSISSLRTTEF